MKRLFFIMAIFFISFMQATTQPVYDIYEDVVNIYVDDIKVSSVDLNTLEVTTDSNNAEITAQQVFKGKGKYLVAIKTKIQGCNCEYLYCSKLRDIRLALTKRNTESQKHDKKCYKPQDNKYLNSIKIYGREV